MIVGRSGTLLRLAIAFPLGPWYAYTCIKCLHPSRTTLYISVALSTDRTNGVTEENARLNATHDVVNTT